MSLIDRSLDGITFLSGQLGAVLQRRLREVGGIALLSLAMMTALALATWSVQDPSLSHATDAPVHNLLGMPGAIAADLMMQLFGLGSLALLLPIAVWGYRLLGHRPLSHERLRVVLWLVGAVLTAAFASCLPRTAHWPLPSGLGGVIGDAMLRLPAVLLHAPLAGSHRLIAAILLGIAALAAFAVAAGIVWREAAEEADQDDEEDEEETEDDDGAWISLGLMAHALLSLRARLARLLRRRAQTPSIWRGEITGPTRRIEPQFGKPAERPADGEAVEAPNDEARRQRCAQTASGAKTAAARGRRLRAAVAQSVDGAARRRADDVERGADPGERRRARRRACRFRRTRRDHQCAAGAGGHALRAGAGAGHQIVARHQPCRRHRPVHERAFRARRRGVGKERDRHRIAQSDPRKGLSARTPRLARLCRNRGAIADVSRQGDRRRSGSRRSFAHAASAHRRHHRIGKIRRHQHDDPQPGLSPASRPVPADHGRSENAGALRLRRHPAPAHPGRHRSEEGGGRAQMGGARNGAALQENVEARRAQHRRLQRARRRGEQQRAKSSTAPSIPATTARPAKRSTRTRSSTSSRCRTSSSSSTKWPT